MSVLKSLESLDGMLLILLESFLGSLCIFWIQLIFNIHFQSVSIGFSSAVKAINQVPQDILFEMV